MGLDISHDCWSGAYSAFARWREKLSEVAGYGLMADYVGFGGGKPFPQNGDVLIVLLDHSDCDGEIAAKDCDPLADRLEQLLPALETAGEGGGHVGSFASKTRTFIAGLRDAASKKEAVEFY